LRTITFFRLGEERIVVGARIVQVEGILSNNNRSFFEPPVIDRLNSRAAT